MTAPLHPRHATREASNALGRILVTIAILAVIWVLRDGCDGEPAWAAEAAPPASPGSPAPAPRACGPACRWSPTVADRAREAWPEVVAAAALEGQDPVLLASIAAYESGMLPVRGGLRNEMWGPGQVHCRTWLRHIRRRHGAPGLTCGDLLTAHWGLAGAALVLREMGRMAGGDRDAQLCGYAHGMRGLALRDGCAYSRAVDQTERLVRHDLSDLVDANTLEPSS